MTDSIVKFPSWRDDLQVNDKKKPLSNFANTLTVLRSDPDLRGMLEFDEMAKTAIINYPPGNPLATDGYPHVVADEDVGYVREHLQTTSGLRHVSRETVGESVNLVAREASYHPVFDMLEALQWDGLPRLDTWLADCFGVEDTPYHRVIGRLFLIALVARIYQPGCKADYMLVIEGEQGKMKSLACETIAGEKWFSDSMPEDITSKDASVHLRGKWLIEVAEMHAFSKAEATHLKSFITRKTERYRPPYGRHEVDEPRQCLFIGTTNKEMYLKDETGGRRFWPFKAVSINLARLKSIRDNLLAEAVAAFKAGEQWWPDPKFEAEVIKPKQEARYDGDAWEEPIGQFLEGRTGTVSIMQIATGCLGYEDKNAMVAATNATPINRLGTHDQHRIMKILDLLEWERLEKKTEKGVVYRRKVGTQV
jgi:predicted P-loop ATPase